MTLDTTVLAVIDDGDSARAILRQAGEYAVETGFDVAVLAVVSVADYERNRQARAAVPALAGREYTLDQAVEAARDRAERLARAELDPLGIPYFTTVEVGDPATVVLAASAAVERVFVARWPRGWFRRRVDPVGRALAGGFDGEVVVV